MHGYGAGPRYGRRYPSWHGECGGDSWVVWNNKLMVGSEGNFRCSWLTVYIAFQVKVLEKCGVKFNGSHMECRAIECVILSIKWGRGIFLVAFVRGRELGTYIGNLERVEAIV